MLLLFFVFPQQYDYFTPFVILTRRRHLDNATFIVFPKHVILKRENIIYTHNMLVAHATTNQPIAYPMELHMVFSVKILIALLHTNCKP